MFRFYTISNGGRVAVLIRTICQANRAAKQQAYRDHNSIRGGGSTDSGASRHEEAMQRLVRNRAAPTGGIIIILLVLTMFAFNFLGDGLRDALEPRLRGTDK